MNAPRPPSGPFIFGKKGPGIPQRVGAVIPQKPAPTLYGDWIEEEITVQYDDGGEDTPESKARKIRARIKSVFGVHPNLNKPTKPGDEYKKFVLTHLPTGLRVSAVSREEDAFKIGERLILVCKKAFWSDTKKGVLSLISDDISQWIISCNQAYKYLDQ